MLKGWPLERQGFVDKYLVSGPVAEEFSDSHTDSNQLRYEAYLRSIIARHEPVDAAAPIQIGQPSRLGDPWWFHNDEGSGFVDCSTFYSLLRRVRFDVSCALVAKQDGPVRAALWSYSAVDLYCNGVKCAEIEHPVYKPIEKRTFALPLHAGFNLVYMACENVGVRDTRSIVGLQLLDHQDDVTVTLPDQSCVEQLQAAEALLFGAALTSHSIRFPQPAAHASYRLIVPDPDFAALKKSDPWHPLADGQQELVLPDGVPLVAVRVDAGPAVLERTFERTEQIRPTYGDTQATIEDNREAIFRRIADVESCNRGEGLHFPIAPILARKHLGTPLPQDDELLAYMVELIDSRIDCSDFLMCGLLRYMKCYPLPEGLQERVKQVILNYRYWMPMEGRDGMCFWSENHALMFYASAMIAGGMYPDEVFPRAHMTGRELEAYGRRLTEDWFRDVEENGFEEFLSTVYMCVTFAALLNVVDYADAQLAARAEKVTGKLLSMLALHIFKGGFIAPMGRVYRNALYPFDQGAIALMNLLNPRLPYSFGEGWLGFYACSGYQLPEGLDKLMDAPVETTYSTGNARIVLEKNDDYCLTSVASPREPGFVRWPNETFDPNADTETHTYTKSFNERFHGTTCFEPGTYGYQQHMWYAALDGQAILFVNHPGSMSENGDMRPGYWHGNGVMPAVRQQHGMIGAIYRIPDEHPLHYTHVYCPACRFDEVRQEANWLLLRKGTGYMALWCSGEMEAYTGMNAGCELRVYGDETAYLCVCGDRTYSDLDQFEAYVRKLTPVFDGRTLTVKGMCLTWTDTGDRTQYL